MRVAVVGGFERGALSESFLNGFREAGADSELVPYMNWRPARPQTLRPMALARYCADAWLGRRVRIRALVRTLSAIRPHLVFFVKCDDLDDPAYRSIREQTGAILGALHPDDPLRQWRVRRLGLRNRHAVTQIKAVDGYFTWSLQLVATLTSIRERPVHYLPFAADLSVYRPWEPEAAAPEYSAQISFIGNWDPERERWLEAVADLDLAIWGDAYWRTRCKSSIVRSAWRGRAAYCDEMAKICGASKITLNVLRDQNKNEVNMRTFELPACGSFFLHERSEALARFFLPGRDCDDFGTPAELREKAQFYLQREDLRTQLAASALDRVGAHTYRERASEVLRAVRAIGVNCDSSQ